MDLDWQHPTGTAPKTVNLVCLGPSKTTYINVNLQNELSHLPADETWTLNRGAAIFRHDLAFVMDNIQGEADQYPNYGATLWKHDKPIITSDNCEDWPNHVHRYPFRLAWNWLQSQVKPAHGDWFHNSLAYIVIYAGMIGVKELRVFGADYTSHSSGVVEDGHPCVAYWCGVMERVGLTVMPVEGSAFLNVNQRHWIYGYRNDPRKAATRARFRDLVGLPALAEGTSLLSGERQVATSLEGIQSDHAARYRFAAEWAYGNVADLGGGIGYGSKILADRPDVQSVTLYDVSAEAISHSLKHYGAPKIIHICRDLDNMSGYVNWDYDFATAFEVIEHLVDPKPMLSNKGLHGVLVCSVPNEQVIPYSPETAPFHHRHYTQEQFNDLLTETGWRVTEWHGQESPTDTDVGPFRPDKSRTIIAVCDRAA